MKFPLAAILLLASTCARAQDDEVLPACVDWTTHPLPAEAQAPRAAAGCDSDALLLAQRYEAARACAWAERAGTEPVSEFAGAATLLALYANGWGVAPDYRLARRMACEAGFAPAEVEARLERIAAMEAGIGSEPLDFCADITSGYMMGHCAERDAVQARAQRAQAWEALLPKWPAAHRTAFARLRTAADAFFEARVQGEVDVSGTARGAFIVGEREALESALLASVQAFERGEWPQGSAADLAAADRQLNASYAAARAAAKFEEPGAMFGPLGSISPDGIRDAERAWIKYRDAWVAFGAVRWPAVAPVAWQHHFTVQRERQLRELVEGY